jgi:hypothetical protein
VWHEYYKPLSFRDTWTAFPTLLRPKSKGLIRLRSKNPRDYPLFYHNYLTDPDDVARLVEGKAKVQPRGHIDYGYENKYIKYLNESWGDLAIDDQALSIYFKEYRPFISVNPRDHFEATA